jgi:hypothetical protein
MASESERRVVVEAGLSDAEQEALAGVPITCLIRAAGRFALCGVTNRECQQQFLDDVLGCFGEGGGGGET